MERIPLLLASASPRRRELLEQAGYHPVLVPSHADESGVVFHPGEPGRYVLEIAERKNTSAAVCLRADPHRYPAGCLLSADTVVLSPDGRPLGKPHSHAEAAEMLASLSGRTHTVHTGVVLRRTDRPGVRKMFAEQTEVTFRSLSAAEIEAYCSTDEPYDKAGGYGIQGAACLFVTGIRGDYYNVVGLPVCRVHETIRDLYAPEFLQRKETE